MITRHNHHQITWLDLINPTTEEIREIVTECEIPLAMSGDLTTMVPRSDVLVRKGILKITLDFPVVKRTDITHPHEIKFIATKTHLVTIRFEDIEAIHRFSQEFEVSSLLAHGGKRATGGHVCMALLLELYRTMTVKLDYLESRMTIVEEEIFNGREKEMVLELSRINRRLISFRQTLYTHEIALKELREKIVTAFGKTFAERVDALQAEYDHQLARLRSLATLMNELQNTNNALLSTKQNEIMKTLTIMAFITFPLTLFTSMFGMNTQTTPILGRQGDFWIILGIMAIVSVGFFAFFKYKKWI